MKPLLFAFAFFIISCGKGGSDPDPLPPPAKKVYLTKITYDDGSASAAPYARILEYDNNDRLIKITTAKPGDSPLGHINFFYDSQNRLAEVKVYGDSRGPEVLHEIRKFYYDAAGNCIGDTAFDENLYKTHYWDNSYTFDSQGRLLSKKHANNNVFRYEYGTGKNPVKMFARFNGLPEWEWFTYNSYDDKKLWLGESAALRLYFRVYAHKYAADFFENNLVNYKETSHRSDGSIYDVVDWHDVMQYNASGYPSKREVKQTNTVGTGIVYRELYEYLEK